MTNTREGAELSLGKGLPSALRPPPSCALLARQLPGDEITRSSFVSSQFCLSASQRARGRDPCALIPGPGGERTRGPGGHGRRLPGCQLWGPLVSCPHGWAGPLDLVLPGCLQGPLHSPLCPQGLVLGAEVRGDTGVCMAVLVLGNNTHQAGAWFLVSPVSLHK